MALAKQAVAEGATPVVLADHSDRSGYATWLLREIIAQDLSNTLIATVADAKATAALKTGAKPGDAFDMEVGGLAENWQANRCVSRAPCCMRIEGLANSGFASGSAAQCAGVQPLSGADHGAVLAEGDGSRPRLVRIIAIKSRVHFRRGFDDNGFAKTILLVEPTEPFLGNDAPGQLAYQNVDLAQFYPYGSPAFSVDLR